MSPMQTYIIFPLLASKMQLKNVKKFCAHFFIICHLVLTILLKKPRKCIAKFTKSNRIMAIISKKQFILSKKFSFYTPFDKKTVYLHAVKHILKTLFIIIFPQTNIPGELTTD